jgi:hypothetical protein
MLAGWNVKGKGHRYDLDLWTFEFLLLRLSALLNLTAGLPLEHPNR